MSALWRQHKTKLCILDSFLRRFARQWQKNLYRSSSSGVLSLQSRGILQTLFPETNVPGLLHHLSKPQTLYCGFDPTADSLHIGNLLAIIALLHFQKAGHTPLALKSLAKGHFNFLGDAEGCKCNGVLIELNEVGGATALIGDPSGKNTERTAIPAEMVKKNALKISKDIQQIVHNYTTHILGETKQHLPPLRTVNNMDWYQEKNVVHFLSTVGRHFRMGPMLSKHSVQSRMASHEGMSFTEFTYQILQAYDWLHLLQQHNCTIQLGGNDQLGNIVAGYELISRVSKETVFGLTVPLVTSSTGNKLGKTAGNAVWLDPSKTSPFELYQYFINVADSDVEQYLKLFTFLPDKEIDNIMVRQNASPEKRIAQNALAEQVTILVHGDTGLTQAVRWTKALYGASIEALAYLQPVELGQLFGQVPVQEMFLDPGTTILDACMKAGCFRNLGDAERIIKAGGVYLNHRRVQQPDFVLIPGEHILPNNTTLIRVGKKNYYIISWSQ